MIEIKPSPDWTVAEVISRCPRAVAVFTTLRMACVGCVMAPFETLAEVAAVYRLEPDAILAQLRGHCVEPTMNAERTEEGA